MSGRLPPRFTRWLPMTFLAVCVTGSAIAGSLGIGAGGPGSLEASPQYRRGAAVGSALAPLVSNPATKTQTTKPLNLSPLYAGPGLPKPTAKTVEPGAALPTSVPAASVKPPTPAPPGFRQSLIQLYQLAVDVAGKASAGIGSSVPLAQAPPLSQFTQALNSVSDTYLSQLYDATQQVSGFSDLPTVYSAIMAELNGNPAGVAGIASTSVAPSATVSAAPASSPGTGVTFTPATTETTSPADNAASCPAGSPGGDYGEDAIYAANLVVDAFTIAASFVPDSIVQGDFVLGEGLVITVPDPGWVAVMALFGAAQIARDTLVWRQAIWNDCNASSQQAEVQVIYDNVNALIGLVDARTTAIDDEEQLLYALVESRTTLILNKIAVIQASLNLELKVTIEEDLLQGTTGSVALFEMPASDGGYLNASPIGVQSLVTSALTSMQQAGETVNPAAPQDLASANAALAAGNYKQAFDLYGQTYREIVG